MTESQSRVEALILIWKVVGSCWILLVICCAIAGLVWRRSDLWQVVPRGFVLTGVMLYVGIFASLIELAKDYANPGSTQEATVLPFALCALPMALYLALRPVHAKLQARAYGTTAPHVRHQEKPSLSIPKD